MKNDFRTWSLWLENFENITLLNSSIETQSSLQLDEIDQMNGFLLPKDYRSFCEVFGTCAFFQNLNIYCPNIRFSENSLYPSREEFIFAQETNEFPMSISSDTIAKVERMLSGNGLAFGDDPSATIYIFDTASYTSGDENCDIWSASGEGLLDDFSFLGRSFSQFFLDSCIEIECTEEESVILKGPIPKNKRILSRFDSNWYIDSV